MQVFKNYAHENGMKKKNNDNMMVGYREKGENNKTLKTTSRIKKCPSFEAYHV